MEVSVAVSGRHKMAISELSAGAWQHLASFLDGYDLVQMFRTGSTALGVRLRLTFDSLCVNVLSSHSVSLSALLRSFAGLSHRPRSFSLSFKNPSRFQLMEEVDYSEIWSHFPSTLRELSLAFPPRSPHLQALNVAHVTPFLEALRLSELPKAVGFALPSTLLSLHLGTFKWGEDALDASLLLPNLPPSLRILKVGPRLLCRDAQTHNLRDSALEVLRAEFVLLYACPKTSISWTFYPATLYDLTTDIFVGTERANAQAPCGDESWSRLFPNLTSLTTPLPYLISDQLKTNGSAELIAHTFPESLTSLSLLNSTRGSSLHADIALVFGLIAQAIGSRLLRLNGIVSGLSVEQHLPHLPNWRNPRISFSNTRRASPEEELDLARATSPCHLLSSEAESLSLGILLPESITRLPTSLTSLEFTMPKANAFHSSILANSWPLGLTSLSMTVSPSVKIIDFNCLPKTLISLRYHAYRTLEAIGDLSLMSRLERLGLHHGSDGTPLFKHPYQLPSSLTHLYTDQWVLDQSIFCAELSKHLERLTTLKMKGNSYYLDIIRYLPRSLTTLEFRSHGREEWTSKLIASLPRKLSRLNCTGALKWSLDMRGSDLLLLPPNLTALNYEVKMGANGLPIDFAEYLPLSLAHLYGPTPEIVARWRQRQNEALEWRRRQAHLKQLDCARGRLILSKAHSGMVSHYCDEYSLTFNLVKFFSFRNPIIAAEVAAIPLSSMEYHEAKSLKRSMSDPVRKEVIKPQIVIDSLSKPLVPAGHWAVLKIQSSLSNSSSLPKLRSRTMVPQACVRAAPGRKTTRGLRAIDLNVYRPSPPDQSRRSSRLSSALTK